MNTLTYINRLLADVSKEFAGIVADNPECEIALKIFHSSIPDWEEKDTSIWPVLLST